MKSKLKNEIYQVIRPNYRGIIYNEFNHPVLRKYCLFPNDNAVTQSLIQGFLYEEYMFDFLKDNSINLIDSDVIEIGWSFYD